jgi:hypothetical protein
MLEADVVAILDVLHGILVHVWLALCLLYPPFIVAVLVRIGGHLQRMNINF